MGIIIINLKGVIQTGLFGVMIPSGGCKGVIIIGGDCYGIMLPGGCYGVMGPGSN